MNFHEVMVGWMREFTVIFAQVRPNRQARTTVMRRMCNLVIYSVKLSSVNICIFCHNFCQRVSKNQSTVRQATSCKSVTHRSINCPQVPRCVSGFVGLVTFHRISQVDQHYAGIIAPPLHQLFICFQLQQSILAPLQGLQGLSPCEMGLSVIL